MQSPIPSSARGAARLAAVAALALATALPAAGQQLEKPNLTVAILPTIGYAPVVIALEDGLFEAAGLTVTYEVTSAPATLNGLLGGTFDFGGIPWLTFLTAYNRGLPLVAATEMERGVPGYAVIMVREDSPVHTPEDLIGRKVGVLSLNGACDVTMNDALREQGHDHTRVEYVALAVPELLPTLMTGGIDAACLPEPFRSPAVAAGGLREVFDIFSGPWEDMPIVGWSTTQAFRDANPNTFAAVQQAMTQALRIANENPDRVRAALLSYTRVPAELAEVVILPHYPAEEGIGDLSAVAGLMERLDMVGGPVRIPGQ